MDKKSIAVLGSTGSIGTQTLDVARNLGLRVTSLAANSNVSLLLEQCREFSPKTVSVGEKGYKQLKKELSGTGTEVLCGDEGLMEIAYSDPSPVIVNAITGIKGLLPTLEAARAGKKIAFANKETLVAGGTLVTEAVRSHGAELLPVDSEHSAIYQCLRCGKEPKKILLTGSGGPFFGKDTAFLETVTPEMAVKHPRWNMGKKISVDSASLMNKGLELIEAVHLFDVPPEKVEVVIHPQSIVHSMVEFADNAVIAQMGTPDMRLCIQYAVTEGARLPSPAQELSLFDSTLTFFHPDKKTFPLLSLAERAIGIGGNIPAAMNGANEEAVALFLEGKISFLGMFSAVIEATENAYFIKYPTLEDIIETDRAAREFVNKAI